MAGVQTLAQTVTPGHCWRGIAFGRASFGVRAGHAKEAQGSEMPSLIRFLVVCSFLGGIVVGGLWVLAVYFEPETKEISKSVRDIELKRE